MKFKLFGKVVSRTIHRVMKKDGTAYDLYQMVIDEPGVYPSRFQIATKDPGLMGDKDGPFGIGKDVIAEGFVNGTARQLSKSDGGTFTKYETWLTVKTLTSAADGAASAPSPAENAETEDYPF